ncbi:MAG: hypothetical protein P1R58_02065 [bacterium]|nr:hypothetical protein [bacterium]
MDENGEQKLKAAAPEKTEVVELSWTTHPVKRRPLLSLGVSLFLLVITWIVYSMTDSEIFAALALIAMFASVAKFYLPTYFTLTDRQVVIRSTTQTIRKDWSMFRSYYADKNGVLLSPFVEPSRLENFRGLYLIFDNNKQEVLTILDKHIGTNSAPDEKD